MTAKLRDVGFVAEGPPPARTGEFLRSEVERWGSVIRSANVTVGWADSSPAFRADSLPACWSSGAAAVALVAVALWAAQRSEQALNPARPLSRGLVEPKMDLLRTLRQERPALAPRIFRLAAIDSRRGTMLACCQRAGPGGSACQPR
jgi:hypothetical protein